MITTTVMTLSEYPPDAVLCTVRLYVGLVEETITFGYRSAKIVMMQDAIVTAVAANAKPSRWSQTSQTAARTARMASTSIRLSQKALPAVTWVQMMNPVTNAAVTGARRRASCQDRSRMSSVVFRHRNVAPCSAQTRTRVRPVHSGYGLSRSQNDPVKSWDELIGSPPSSPARATPISSGASALPV